METLPTELIAEIIGFLSFQNIINLLFVVKKFRNIIIRFSLIPKKISKYVILCNNDYLILVKYKPLIKTLMIQGHIINLREINLTEINYKRLYLKDIDISINDVKMLDKNISQKCKKITFCKLFLPNNFVNSFTCLDVCKTIRFFYPIDNNCGKYGEYDYFLKFVLFSKIPKIVLSHWILRTRQIFFLSTIDIVKLKKSLIYGDITKLVFVSHFYAIECRTWSPELECYGPPESFEKTPYRNIWLGF